MTIPTDTDKVTPPKHDEEFEAMLEEMASLLETEEDLDVNELSDDDFHSLDDGAADLGEEYFNLRDGPVVVGAPVVDPELRDDPAATESQEIQLIFDDRPAGNGDHVVEFRMMPGEDRDMLSMDADSVDDEVEEASEPSLPRPTVRKRLGKLLSLFRDDD